MNQSGSLSLKIRSNSNSVEEYLVGLMTLALLHVRKPDVKRCEDLAEPIIAEIRLKARQSGSIRFRDCAEVIDEEGLDTEYKKLLRFIVAVEREADGSAELTIVQRDKAYEMLALPGNQYVLKLIEPEFRKYFTLEEDGKTQGLSEPLISTSH